MASFSPCHHAVVVAVVSLMMATAEAYFQPSAWIPAHATFYGDESGVGDDMGMSLSIMFSFSSYGQKGPTKAKDPFSPFFIYSKSFLRSMK